MTVSGGWWSWLGLSYITENVYGTITDSKPEPNFISPDDKGVVVNDNMEQLSKTIWKELIGLFSPGDDKHIEGLDEKIR